MNEWKEYKLGELAHIKGGKRLPKGNILTAITNSHPYIRIKDMGSRFLSFENLEYVPDDLFPYIKNYTVNRGEVIISIVGSSIGLVSIVNEELHKASLTENCAKILPKTHQLNDSFLYYFLVSEWGQSEIFKKIVGAAQPKLPIYNINDISIWVPSLSTQNNIVEILSSLDDKIELNNAINKNLEDLAQSLFKQWFIDFEFPNENGDPYKSAGGDMVDSEFGEIPKGWTLKCIFDYAKFINGAAYRDMFFSIDNDALPVVKIVELKYGISSNTKYTKTNLGDRYRINTGDILFSWSGSPETSIDTFLWVHGDAWLNQHIFKIICKNNVERSFVYPMLKKWNPTFISIARDKQTTGLGHVTVNDLKKLMQPCPSDEVLSSYSLLVIPILEYIQNTLEENEYLKKLRDILLPKLISGEIEVDDNIT